MKRYTIGLTLLFALMNTGCEDTKDDKLGYSFPKISKTTHYDSADKMTGTDNCYWNGNTLTRYYLENGEETEKKQSVFEYNKYGRHIKRTYYNTDGSIRREYIYERDKWKFLNYKYYNENGHVYRHRIFEWDGLTAKVLDGLDNNRHLYDYKYDEKANLIYSKNANQDTYYDNEYDSEYRSRLLNRKMNGIIEYTYEWTDNKYISRLADGTTDGYVYEVNEFDDRIKVIYPDGRYSISEYHSERFKPYYTK